MFSKIKMRTVSIISLITTLLLIFFCIGFFIQGNYKLQLLMDAPDRFINCEHAAAQLKDTSDYLTEQARLFVSTSKLSYMQDYFTEVNETKRREDAIDYLGSIFSDTQAFTSLQSAFNSSYKLMDAEYQAMRLTLEANNYPEYVWPDEIKAVKLTEADQHCSNTAKQRKAQRLLFDENYLYAKSMINADINQCVDELINITHEEQAKAASQFYSIYTQLEIAVGIFALMITIISFAMRGLVVNPILSYNNIIHDGKMLPLIGASEIRNLAGTYNKMFLENEKSKKIIRHEAEHDPLTDLYNRGVFNKQLSFHQCSDKPFALMIVDIDVFKSINDTYGHAIGDEMLKKVAELLVSGFRSTDLIYRIGGDEFAVMILGFEQNNKELIDIKVREINYTLMHPHDELPAASISVGAAFYDGSSTSSSMGIFKCADKALYHTKASGRSGCSFY